MDNPNTCLHEKEFPWMRGHPEKEQPFCKVTMKPQKSTLKRHGSSASILECTKLQASSPIHTMIQRAPIGVKSKRLKDAEPWLATVVACHTSLPAVDHFRHNGKKCVTGSPLLHLPRHRTKCSHLINHVLAPAFKEEFVTDAKDVPLIFAGG